MPSVSEEEVVSQSDGQRRRRREVELSREDCLCPVCLEIFVEPVTLPCTHTFCKECFLQSVDKATLCCPMCRRRVSTWTRLHSRTNSLVNQQLWTRIQTSFPLQCERRLTGQEVDNTEEHIVTTFPRVCQPGELRQEYEDQINKMTEERRVLDEEQRKASEELIQKLMEEDQLFLQEENRRSEEDQRLALLLSDQLNYAPPPSDGSAPPPQKKMHVVGQIEKFLSPCHLTPLSFTSNKENLNRSEPHPLYRPRRTFGVSLQRMSSEEQEEFGVSLHVPALPSPSSSTLQEELHDHGQWQQEEEEKEEEKDEERQQQEEEDRQLALLLQKELDQEERQKATDRRKGTPSAYLLRRGGEQRSRRRTSATSSATSSSTSSSTFSCYRRTKQTTLTDMFSSS